MTKVKIGGQKYNLEDLPESFRNRIQSELDKEGIKYDKEDDTGDNNGDNNKIKDGNKKGVDTKRSRTKAKKNDSGQKEMSLFRKMFGYP